MASYVDYAESPQQEQVARLMDEGLKPAGIAKEVGRDEANVRRSVRAIKSRAHHAGYNPDYGMLEGYPAGSHFTKATVQRLGDGTIERVWDRFSKDEAEKLHCFMQAAEKISKTHTPYPIIPQTKRLKYNNDLIPWYQIGDGHIGMLAHESVVGNSFDLDIGKQELEYAILKLIGNTEPCDRCVIQDCGDMSHYENIKGVTDKSGNLLDCAGTYGQMLDVCMELMQTFISAALRRHRHVDVIINQGNHSQTNDMWMARHLRHMYSNNPRVTVLDNDSVFIPYRMGNTFVVSHHGHETKPQNMPAMIHNDYRQDCGEALYKYVDTAHVHHAWTSKDISGVTVESFNNLAVGDKHAHTKGYRSRSFLVCVMRSKTYGETGRSRVTQEEVRDAIHGRSPGDTAAQRSQVHTV